MISPFARFTNAKTGRPSYVDVFEVVAVDTDKDDPSKSETQIIFTVGGEAAEMYVAEDPDAVMSTINETLNACSGAV